MLKRKDSPYLAGRPKGHWYKWKRAPLTLDAVLMYAQRGRGKRRLIILTIRSAPGGAARTASPSWCRWANPIPASPTSR